MHFPVMIPLGPIKLHPHLVFEIAAYTIGFRLFLRTRSQKGDHYSTEKRLWVILGGLAGAALGSKLLGVLDTPDFWSSPTPLASLLLGGKSIVGGLLGGLFGVEVTKKIVGETRSSGDLFTLPLIIGMITGRIGCALTGVSDSTVGISSNLPWAYDMGDGIARHPTSLYEILFLLVLGMGLLFLERRWALKEGAQFKIFITGYLGFRFFIEFLKPVPLISFGPIFALSVIQVACLVGLIYYRTVFTSPRSLLS